MDTQRSDRRTLGTRGDNPAITMLDEAAGQGASVYRVPFLETFRAFLPFHFMSS